MKFQTLLIVLLFFSFSAIAVQPQQMYNKIFIDPLYRESLNADTDYIYTLKIDTPDGISEVQNAMVNFQVWHNPSIRYYLLVNGQTCNTESFYVSTSYANAGEGNIFFDCSNVIRKEGDYTITLRTDDDTGTITGWIDLTYMNNPKADVEVHGTEYIYGEDAKIWLQLLNASDGQDIEGGVCYVDIYTPDNLEYVEHAIMNNMVHDGIYYYDLPVPFGAGVYPVIAKCYYEATSNQRNASSYAIYEGKLDGGTIDDTWTINGQYLKLDTDDNIGPTTQLDVNVSFSDFYTACGTIDENLMSSVSVYWFGKWNTGDINHDVLIYVWNYSSGSWVGLSNPIGGGNGGDLFGVSNSLDTNNITKLLGITSTNPMKIRFADTTTEEGKKDFDSDRIYTSCEQLSNPEWQEVKGSSEMHVSSEYEWETSIKNGEVKNDTYPGEFNYNFTIESGVGVNKSDVEVFIQLPTPFPCHHVNELWIDGVEFNWTPSNPSNVLQFGCQLNWEMDLNVSTNYEAMVIAENWYKEIENIWLTQSQIENDIISIACENYQEANGLPNYTIPIVTDPNLNRIDNYYDACSAYFDSFYHFNETYFGGFAFFSATLTALEMTALDEQWRHLEEMAFTQDNLAKSIMQGMTLGGTYSIAVINDPYPPTNPNYTIYWAGVADNYINFQQLFGLTSGAVNVSLNTSEITNSVWNYGGIISSTILDYIGLNVWLQPSRNLTYYNDTTNYTRLTDDVWNSSNKYTYGVIIP